MEDVVSLNATSPQVGASTFVVPRKALHQVLNRSVVNRMNCIVAPAGFGKTTLMQDWIEREQRRAVWFTLDRCDNDPLRLLRRFCEVLHGHGYTVEAVPQCGAVPAGNDAVALDELELVRRCYRAVASGLGFANKHLSLVLDDVYKLHSSEAVAALLQIADIFQGNISFYFLSRESLPSELFSIVAGGQSTVLGAGDLAFQLDEGRQYLKLLAGQSINVRFGARSPYLRTEALVRVWRESEGWPIFFCAMLAQLLDKTLDPSKSSSFFMEPNLQAYIQHEILGNTSDDVNALLVELAPMVCFNRVLIAQCLRFPDGENLFQQIVHSSGLVIKVPGSQHDYCIRRPVRAYLRSQYGLGHTESGLAAFNKVYRWYLARNGIYEAVTLCVDKAFWQSAIYLIEVNYRHLAWGGRWHVVADWIDALPMHLLRSRPLLLMLQARKSLFECAPVTALDFLRRARECLSSDEAFEHPEDLYVGSRRESLRLEVCKLIDSIQSLYLDEGLTSFSRLQTERDGAVDMPLIDVYMRGLKAFYLNMYSEAKSDLFQVLERSNDNARGVLLSAISLLGWIHFVTGELVQWRSVVATMAGRVAASAECTALLNDSVALVNLELGEIEDSNGEFDDASFVQGACLPRDVVFHNLLARAVAAIQLEQVCEAEHILVEASVVAQELPGVVRQSFFSVNALKAEVELLKGREEEAMRALDIWGGNEAGFAFQHECLVKADVLLALDRPPEAIQLASCVRGWAEKQQSGILRLRSLVTESIAYQKLGRDHKALSLFNEALQVGRVIGGGQSFRRASPEIFVLLRKSQQLARYPAYLSKLVAICGGGKEVIGEPSVSLAALTRREREVLDLLAKGMSNSEIAKTLSRSLGTIKIHVHNIYGKLGVTNRVAVVNKYLRIIG